MSTKNKNTASDVPSLEQDDTWKALWDECALAGDPDPNDKGLTPWNGRAFIEKWLPIVFQTRDSDSLAPRVQVLAQRVVERFSPQSAQDDPPGYNEVTGALRFLEAVYERRGRLISQTDRARLLGAMGMLCRNFTAEGASSLRKFWQNRGLQTLKDAVNVGESVPASLQRHLHWLLADTLIGAVDHMGRIKDRANETDAVKHLLLACEGDPLHATTGLYFSCISRLFTLSDKARLHFCREMLDDLRRAWCLIGAATFKHDRADRQANDGKPGGKQARLPTARERFVSAGLADLRKLIPDLLEWHVEDRFAVCALLGWFEKRRGRADVAAVYSYEASALLEKLSPQHTHRPNEPRVVIHPVRQLLESARRLAPMERPKLHKPTGVPQTGGPEAMKHIEKGNVEAAEAALQRQAQSSRYSVERYMCRLKIAELRGDANGSESEKGIIQDVLKELPDDENRYHAMVRAEAFRLLSRNAAHSNEPHEADQWINHALISAGAAASPQLASLVMRHLFGLRKDSEAPLSDRPIQGQLAWAFSLWNRPEWIEGGYSASLDGYRRGIRASNRPDQNGPRALKRRVANLGRNATPEALLNLAKEAWQMDPGSLVGPWTDALVNLYRCIDMSHHNNGRRAFPFQEEAYRLMDGRESELADLVTHGLAKGRAADFRERLAMLLCEWLKRVKLRSPLPDSAILQEAEEHVSRSVNVALEIALSRIRLLRTVSRARQNAARRRLRRLVHQLSEADCLHLVSWPITGLLDECKTNDASLDYLKPISEQLLEEFDDFSSLLPEPHENDFTDTQKCHSPSQPHS